MRARTLVLVSFIFFSLSAFLGVFFSAFTSFAHAAVIVPIGGGPPPPATIDITSDTHWTIAESPHVIEADTVVATGTTLTIDPGVIVKFEPGTGLSVAGVLHANGTEVSPVYFTAISDDIGGDTNNDGTSTLPSSGSWARIFFGPGAEGSFSYSTVRYAGEWESGLTMLAGVYNDGATLSLDHVNITDDTDDGLVQTNNGTTTASNIKVSGNLTYGVYADSGAMTIDDSTITNNGMGIEAVNALSTPTVSVARTKIFNNTSGIISFGASLSVTNSSIHDNTVSGLRNSKSGLIDAESNWWGDASGPTTPQNQGGTGDAIHYGIVGTGDGSDPTDAVSFRPWLTSDPFAPPPIPKYDNVLFLPGIEGSRLYEGAGCGGTAVEKLWEPDSLGWDSKLQELGLDASGNSVCSDIYTKPGDIVDSVYQSFENEMNGLVASGTIAAWEPVAYDWRLSLPDLLTKGAERGGKIYYGEATSTPYIEQELRRLAASSKTGKVTIIAHSNGGLVAKALLNKLGADAANLVDKVILVAVPQSGAPAAVGSLLVGYDSGIQRFGVPIVDNVTARTFTQNAPMTYHLLPSEDYLESTAPDTAHRVVSFEGSAYAKEIAAYGTSIANRASLDDFLLAKEGGRTQAADADLWSAKIANTTLVDYANSQHATLDYWTPPAGVSVDEVAGWGIDTVAGIDFYTASWLDMLLATPRRAYRPVFTEDGDGTVTIPSALQMNGADVKRYWVDLAKVNNIPGTQIEYKHPNILELPSLQDLIKNLLENSTSTLPSYIQDIRPAPLDSTKKLTYFLHSPLTLQIADASGDVTGIGADGTVSENIPGSSYGEFGEVKYVTVPEGNTYQLTMHGLASGTFSLDMQERTGDAITASSTIAGVPTTASTTVTMAVSADVSIQSPMTIDENGDGMIDTTITPRLGQTVVFDDVPPELQVTFSTTTRAIVWSATDNSGYAVITSTTSPIRSTLEGNPKRNDRNVDEDEKGSRDIAERDEEHRDPLVTTVTARDAAGNTTALTYAQTPTPASQSARDAIILRSIAYNGATTTLAGAGVSYSAVFNKHKNGLEAFVANLHTASSTVMATYERRKNETIIMTYPVPRPNRGRSDSLNHYNDMIPKRQVLPGLVVPYMETEKGSLLIIY